MALLVLYSGTRAIRWCHNVQLFTWYHTDSADNEAQKRNLKTTDLIGLHYLLTFKLVTAKGSRCANDQVISNSIHACAVHPYSPHACMLTLTEPQLRGMAYKTNTSYQPLPMGAWSTNKLSILCQLLKPCFFLFLPTYLLIFYRFLWRPSTMWLVLSWIVRFWKKNFSTFNLEQS